MPQRDESGSNQQFQHIHTEQVSTNELLQISQQQLQNQEDAEQDKFNPHAIDASRIKVTTKAEQKIALFWQQKQQDRRSKTTIQSHQQKFQRDNRDSYQQHQQKQKEDNEKNLPAASHSPLKSFGPDIRMTKGTYVPLNSIERKLRLQAPSRLFNNSNLGKTMRQNDGTLMDGESSIADSVPSYSNTGREQQVGKQAALVASAASQWNQMQKKHQQRRQAIMDQRSLGKSQITYPQQIQSIFGQAGGSDWNTNADLRPQSSGVVSCNSNSDSGNEEEILQGMQLKAMNNQNSVTNEDKKFVQIKQTSFQGPVMKDMTKNTGKDSGHTATATQSPRPHHSFIGEVKRNSMPVNHLVSNNGIGPAYLTAITTKGVQQKQHTQGQPQYNLPLFKKLKTQNLASGCANPAQQALVQVISARKRSMPLASEQYIKSFIGSTARASHQNHQNMVLKPKKMNISLLLQHGSINSHRNSVYSKISSTTHTQQSMQESGSTTPLFFNKTDRSAAITIVNEGESVRKLLTRNGRPFAKKYSHTHYHQNPTTSHVRTRPTRSHQISTTNSELGGNRPGQQCACSCGKDLLDSKNSVSSRNGNNKITINVSEDARITIGSTSYRLSSLLDQQISYGQQALLDSQDRTSPILVTKQAPKTIAETGLRQETARQKYNLLVQATAAYRRYSNKRGGSKKQKRERNRISPQIISAEGQRQTSYMTALQSCRSEDEELEDDDVEDEVASLVDNDSINDLQNPDYSPGTNRRLIQRQIQRQEDRQRASDHYIVSNEGYTQTSGMNVGNISEADEDDLRASQMQQRETKDISLQISQSRIMPDGHGFMLNSDENEESKCQRSFKNFAGGHQTQNRDVLVNSDLYPNQTPQNLPQNLKTTVLKKQSDSRIVMSQLHKKPASPANKQHSTYSPNRTLMTDRTEYRKSDMHTTKMGGLSVQVRPSQGNSPDILSQKAIIYDPIKDQSIWSTSHKSSDDQGTPRHRLGPTNCSLDIPVDTKNGAVRITTQLPAPFKLQKPSSPKPMTTASSPGKGVFATLKVKQFRFMPKTQANNDYLYTSREGNVQGQSSHRDNVLNGQTVPWQAAQPLKSYIGVIPVLDSIPSPYADSGTSVATEVVQKQALNSNKPAKKRQVSIKVNNYDALMEDSKKQTELSKIVGVMSTNLMNQRNPNSIQKLAMHSGESSNLLIASKSNEPQIAKLDSSPENKFAAIKNESDQLPRKNSKQATTSKVISPPKAIIVSDQQPQKAWNVASSIEGRNLLQINTVDLKMMPPFSPSPKFGSTKNDLNGGDQPGLQASRNSPMRVKNFIEIGSRVRVHHYKQVNTTPNISSNDNNCQHLANNPGMLNQLRANSYIDRKSICDDNTQDILTQAVKTRKTTKIDKQIAHNSSRTTQASLLNALKYVQQSTCKSGNSRGQGGSVNGEDSMNIIDLSFNKRQIKVLDSVPVTLIPLKQQSYKSNENGLDILQQQTQHLGQFYISGKATNPVPVATINRDLQKISMIDHKDASLMQQFDSRNLNSRGTKTLNSGTITRDANSKEKIVSFNNSPQVKELIIAYPVSQRAKPGVNNVHFNFQEKSLPKTPTTSFQRASQPGHYQVTTLTNNGFQ